jgi:hypothetical protein
MAMVHAPFGKYYYSDRHIIIASSISNNAWCGYEGLWHSLFHDRRARFPSAPPPPTMIYICSSLLLLLVMLLLLLLNNV